MQTLKEQNDSGKTIHDLVGAHAQMLSEKLQAHRLQLFAPTATKTLSRFSSAEAAKLIGVHEGYIRRLAVEGKGPAIEVGAGGAAPTPSRTSRSCGSF